MSVILQKDKITGETLVYETTNYRDKKTGKSGTRKELLGWLYTSSLSQDYGYVGDLLEKGPEILGEITELMNKSSLKTQELNRAMAKAGYGGFSTEEMMDIFGRFMELMTDKDEINDKLMAFNKEIVIRAAEVQRMNEMYEDLDQSNKKCMDDAQGLIAAQKDSLQIYKELVANYEKLRTECMEQIGKQKEQIEGLHTLSYAQDGMLLQLINSLSKYEDTSKWDKVKETCEATVARYASGSAKE